MCKNQKMTCGSRHSGQSAKAGAPSVAARVQALSRLTCGEIRNFFRAFNRPLFLVI